MEAVQHPEKVTVCIIKNNIQPQIMKFIISLKARGLRMCRGFDELLKVLDIDLQDMTDIAAFHWWRQQSISGAVSNNTHTPAVGAVLSIARMRSTPQEAVIGRRGKARQMPDILLLVCDACACACA